MTPPRPSHAAHLTQAGDRVLHEVHHELCQARVEGVVLKRQLLGGCTMHGDLRIALPNRGDERFRGVDGGHGARSQTTDQLGRERSGPAAHVEHVLSARHPRKIRELWSEWHRVPPHEPVVRIGGNSEAHRGPQSTCGQGTVHLGVLMSSAWGRVPCVEVVASQQLSALARVGGLLEDAGIDSWLFGGWAVDFYAGSVTRPHDDVDLAIWLEDLPRIAELLEVDGWRHAPAADEDGGTGYERGPVRLELTYLVRGGDGRIFTPLRHGAAVWPDEALAKRRR